MELSNFLTYELINELTKREGVEEIIIEPYEDKEIAINGPARVFIVVD